MTTLRVLKFGGTSVGAPDRLVRVTELIARERGLGPIAVVVSAMGDTTDWLLEAAHAAARGDTLAAGTLVDRAMQLAIDAGLGALHTLLTLPDARPAAPADVPAADVPAAPAAPPSRTDPLAPDAPTDDPDARAHDPATAPRSDAAPAAEHDDVPERELDALEPDASDPPPHARDTSPSTASDLTAPALPLDPPERDLAAQVREQLAPIRQVLAGVALLRQCTP